MAAVASGCVGPQLRPDRPKVAVLPTQVYFRGHYHTRARPVIAYDCRTYPPLHVVELVDDVVGSDGGHRSRQNIERGKMQRLIDAVVVETWGN